MHQLEPVESSLISHRGYDPEKQIMFIRFKHKTMTHGSLYEYGNISPKLYAEACAWRHDKTTEPSFGQFFQRFIKPDEHQYPFRQLEQAHNGDGFVGTTLDFESGAPVPATTPEPEVIDEDELLRRAEALTTQARSIVINSPEAYEAAATLGMGLAKACDGLEKVFRPKINAARAPYQNLLDLFNRYFKPMQEDQDRLRRGMATYNRQQEQIRRDEETRLRRQQEIEAERIATQKSVDLHLHDAVTAEARGEPELAESIMASTPLPVAPSMPAPIRVASQVPIVKGTVNKEKWEFEVKNESEIPDEYWILDTKAIAKVVSAMKARTNIPGIYAYDAGTVAFGKK